MFDNETPNGKRDQDNPDHSIRHIPFGTDGPWDTKGVEKMPDLEEAGDLGETGDSQETQDFRGAQHSQGNRDFQAPESQETQDFPEALDSQGVPDSSREPLGSSGPPPKRTLDFLEVIYGVLVQPRETFNYLAEARPVLQAGVFLFITTLVNFLVSWRELNALPPEAQLFTGFSAAILPLFLVGLIAAVIAWFVKTGTITLVSQLFGGVGNGVGLLCAFSFVTLPFMIVGILEYLIGLFFPSLFLVGISGLAGFIWYLVLNVLALQEIELLSRSRAILVYFVVPLSIIVSVFIFVLVMAALFAPVIQQMQLL